MSKQKTIIIILVAIILALAIVASSAIFLLFNNKNNTPNNTTGGDNPSDPSNPDNPSNPGNPNLNDSENSVKYLQAISMIESGKYAEAYEILVQLGNYKDSANYLSNFYYFPTKVITTDFSDKDIKGHILFDSVEIIFNDKYFPTEYVETYDGESYTDQQFTFDSEGRLTRESAYNSAYEYIYDSNGNLIKETYSYDGEMRYIYEYKYDYRGNLIEEIQTDSEYPLTKNYTYNHRGDLTKVVWFRPDLDTVTGVQEYFYDADNRIVSYIGTYSDDRHKDTIDYTYDTKGNLVKRVEKYAYEPSYTYYFTYDDNNNLIQELREDVVNRKSYIDYTYDSKGQIIKTVKYSSESTAVYTYEYSYDKYGNLIEYKYLDVYETQKHEYNPETGWYEPVGDPYLAENKYTQKIDYILVYTANIEQYEDTFELFNYIYEDTFELLDIYQIK